LLHHTSHRAPARRTQNPAPRQPSQQTRACKHTLPLAKRTNAQRAPSTSQPTNPIHLSNNTARPSPAPTQETAPGGTDGSCRTPTPQPGPPNGGPAPNRRHRKTQNNPHTRTSHSGHPT